MATVKPILRATTLINSPGHASARVRCYIDYGTDYMTDPAVDAVNQAIQLLPQIGDTGNIGSVGGFAAVLGPPTSLQLGLSGFPSSRATHDLRVVGHAAGVENSGSVQKYYIDVLYESRPRPTIEMGSASLPQSTTTYLSKDGSRQQMMLGWTIPANLYGPQSPPEVTEYLNSPVNGSRMQFGSTVRISSVWYTDELSPSDILNIQGLYSTTINRGDLFYQPAGVHDRRLWLCSSVGCTTNDGGYSTRLTGEFVFNPEGWDSVGVFTIPYSSSPARLTTEVANQLTQQLPLMVGRIPDPYLPTQGGAGRWPQQYETNLIYLVGFLSQGILVPQPTLQNLISGA